MIDSVAIFKEAYQNRSVAAQKIITEPVRELKPEVTAEVEETKDPVPTQLHAAIGKVLRKVRTEQGKTLRQVAADALISLGYLSEIELAKKEFSSVSLNWIIEALDLSLPELLKMTIDTLEEE